MSSKAESSSAAAGNSITANTSATAASYDLPWCVLASISVTPQNLTSNFRVEKYRPVYLDDIVGNSETIERLKIIAKDGNMPHVIISGMPGIGKTTSILCLARQLLGDAYREAVLELNASDERGTPDTPDIHYVAETLTSPIQASTSSATASKASPRKKSPSPPAAKNSSSSTKPTA